MHEPFIAGSISFLLFVYMALCLRSDLTEKRVQHRWYFLERSKRYAYATRKEQPVEYWLTVVIHLFLTLTLGWFATVGLVLIPFFSS